MESVYYLLLKRHDIQLNGIKVVHQLVSKKAAKIITKEYVKLRLMTTLCQSSNTYLFNRNQILYIPILRQNNIWSINYIEKSIHRKNMLCCIIQLFTFKTWRVLCTVGKLESIMVKRDDCIYDITTDCDRNLKYVNVKFMFKLK